MKRSKSTLEEFMELGFTAKVFVVEVLKVVRKWVKEWQYTIDYSLDSIVDNLNRDKRALNLAMKAPLSQEDARRLIDLGEFYEVSDELMEELTLHAYQRGMDPTDFAKDVLYLFDRDKKRTRKKRLSYGRK